MMNAPAIAVRGLPVPGWWRATKARVIADATEGQLAFRGLIAFTFILMVAPQEFIKPLGLLRPARIAVILAAIAYMVDCWKHPNRERSTSIEVVLAGILFVWSVVTIPLSYWPSGSIALLSGLFVKALIAFWLIGKVVNRFERLRTLLWMLTIFSVPLALTGVHNYVTGNFVPAWCGCMGPHVGNAKIERINGYGEGLAGNPNDLALTLDIIIPLAIALFVATKRWSLKLLLLAIIAVDAATVVLTFSRGGFIALAVMLLLCVFWMIQRRALLLAGAMVLGGLISLPFLPAKYTNRLDTMLNLQADTTGSAQDRYRDTVVAIEYVVEHPFVGAGLGMDYLALNEMRGPTWRSVHNTYLNYGVDLGMPGLVLFVAILVTAIWRVRHVEKLANQSPDSLELGLLSRGVRIALIGFAAGGFFYPVGYHFYFYYLAGLAVAIGTIGRRRFAGAQA